MYDKPIIPNTVRASLVTEAKNSVSVLANNLSILFDAYDFHIAGKSICTGLEESHYYDLQTSLYELEILPKYIAEILCAWEYDLEYSISRQDFELQIINEFYIHMDVIKIFLLNNLVDISAFDEIKFSHSILVLRTTNRMLSV